MNNFSVLIRTVYRRLFSKRAKVYFCRLWRSFILTFGPFLVHSDYFFDLFLSGRVHSERQLLGVHSGVPGHAEPPRTHLVTFLPDMSRGLSVEDLGAAADLRPLRRYATIYPIYIS